MHTGCGLRLCSLLQIQRDRTAGRYFRTHFLSWHSVLLTCVVRRRRNSYALYCIICFCYDTKRWETQNKSVVLSRCQGAQSNDDAVRWIQDLSRVGLRSTLRNKNGLLRLPLLVALFQVSQQKARKYENDSEAGTCDEARAKFRPFRSPPHGVREPNLVHIGETAAACY